MIRVLSAILILSFLLSEKAHACAAEMRMASNLNSINFGTAEESFASSSYLRGYFLKFESLVHEDAEMNNLKQQLRAYQREFGSRHLSLLAQRDHIKAEIAAARQSNDESRLASLPRLDPINEEITRLEGIRNALIRAIDERFAKLKAEYLEQTTSEWTEMIEEIRGNYFRMSAEEQSRIILALSEGIDSELGYPYMNEMQRLKLAVHQVRRSVNRYSPEVYDSAERTRNQVGSIFQPRFFSEPAGMDFLTPDDASGYRLTWPE